MEKLTEGEKKELKELAHSAALRAELAEASRRTAGRKLSLDEFVAFLNAYNGFVNHQPRQFQKIEGGGWLV